MLDIGYVLFLLCFTYDSTVRRCRPCDTHASSSCDSNGTRYGMLSAGDGDGRSIRDLVGGLLNEKPHDRLDGGARLPAVGSRRTAPPCPGVRVRLRDRVARAGRSAGWFRGLEQGHRGSQCLRCSVGWLSWQSNEQRRALYVMLIQNIGYSLPKSHTTRTENVYCTL